MDGLAIDMVTLRFLDDSQPVNSTVSAVSNVKISGDFIN